MAANGQALNNSNTPTYAQLKAMVEALQKQVAEQPKPGKLTVRINDEAKTDPKTGAVTGGKGTVCVYGNGRFPMPYYAEQWERLFEGVTAPEGTVVHAILQACKDPRASRKVKA